MSIEKPTYPIIRLLFGFVSHSLYVILNRMIHYQIEFFEQDLIGFTKRRMLPGRSTPLACPRLCTPECDHVFHICYRYCQNIINKACLQLSGSEYDDVFDRFCYRYFQHVIIMVRKTYLKYLTAVINININIL